MTLILTVAEFSRHLPKLRLPANKPSDRRTFVWLGRIKGDKPKHLVITPSDFRAQTEALKGNKEEAIETISVRLQKGV